MNTRKTLHVDGVARSIKGAWPDRNGWSKVQLGDHGSPLVHSVHAVPQAWFDAGEIGSSVFTGGHTYKFEAQS